MFIKNPGEIFGNKNKINIWEKTMTRALDAPLKKKPKKSPAKQ